MDSSDREALLEFFCFPKLSSGAYQKKKEKDAEEQGTRYLP